MPIEKALDMLWNNQPRRSCGDTSVFAFLSYKHRNHLAFIDTLMFWRFHSWQPFAAKKLLRKHGARAFRVYLGSWGSSTPKPVPLMNWVCSFWIRKKPNDCQTFILEVILYGTSPWLGELSKPLTAFRRLQLRRQKAFFKIENTRVYTDRRGQKKCVGISVWCWPALMFTFRHTII